MFHYLDSEKVTQYCHAMNQLKVLLTDTIRINQFERFSLFMGVKLSHCISLCFKINVEHFGGFC